MKKYTPYEFRPRSLRGEPRYVIATYITGGNDTYWDPDTGAVIHRVPGTTFETFEEAEIAFVTAKIRGDIP